MYLLNFHLIKVVFTTLELIKIKSQMKKLSILKIETILQSIISAVAAFFFLSDWNMFILFGLFWIGVSNIVGFLIRIFLIQSKFNIIYSAAVVLFFLLLGFLASFTTFLDEYFVHFISIFGILLNLFYIFYGFILIKNWNQKSIETKS